LQALYVQAEFTAEGVSTLLETGAGCVAHIELLTGRPAAVHRTLSAAGVVPRAQARADVMLPAAR
jgi:hypothetical protein